jgi:hypothetical protein
MPEERLQVVPLDVFLQGVQNGKRRRRQKAHTPQESTGGSARRPKTQAKSDQLIQPVTALLFLSILATQEQNAVATTIDHHDQGSTTVHMAAPHTSTAKSSTPAPESSQEWVIRLQKWQVGLGCVLCQAIVGIVLFLLSLNPFGMSAFLVPPAILYLLFLWLDSTARKTPFTNLFVVNCLVGITALVFYLINSLTP